MTIPIKKNLLAFYLFFFFCVEGLISCSATGDEETITPSKPVGTDSMQNSVTSSTTNSSSSNTKIDLFTWEKISAGLLTRGSVTYSISSFEITTTEVTQKAYKEIMGDIPEQSNIGDNYPIENVNWYQAALFCNAYSKILGKDTTYIYSSIGDEYYLEDLSIDYNIEGSIRLLTENEWEIAMRGGTSTTYYWDTDEAKKYAYYGQSKGPAQVAQYLPNSYNLFDMAGNVSEWVNDWYGNYPNVSSENPTGPESGSLRVVRGGGWSDKVSSLASSEREKKNPLYKSHTLGFRIGKSIASAK